MNISQISRVWTDETHVYAVTADGRVGSHAFADWPRLLNATTKQRENFFLSPIGVHWEEVDEDLTFDGFFK